MKTKTAVLIGPECSGKSTLAKYFKDNYKIPFSKEYARQFALKKKGDLESGDVPAILKGQQKAEEKLRKDNPDAEFLIFDTNLVASQIYAEWYFGTFTEGLREIIQDQEYTKYYLCERVPWTPDPSRGPDEGEAMFGFFKSRLDEMKIPYVVLEGPVEKRAEKMYMDLKSEPEETEL